ncbi:MAG: hypothetical protein JXQ87_00545 [Bacteroidia bacterium]
MTWSDRFFRFYFLPIIGWGGLFIFMAIIDLIKKDFEGRYFVTYLLIWLLASILIGGMLDFAANVYTPLRRKGIYKKSPFKDLLDGGFQLINETHLEIQIDGFHYGVLWDGSFKPTISIMVLFSPTGFEEEDNKRVVDLLKKSGFNDLVVADGILKINLDYNFTRPGYKKIEASINQLKQASSTLNLKPISNIELGKMWAAHMESKYG